MVGGNSRGGEVRDDAGAGEVRQDRQQRVFRDHDHHRRRRCRQHREPTATYDQHARRRRAEVLRDERTRPCRYRGCRERGEQDPTAPGYGHPHPRTGERGRHRRRRQHQRRLDDTWPAHDWSRAPRRTQPHQGRLRALRHDLEPGTPRQYDLCCPWSRGLGHEPRRRRGSLLRPRRRDSPSAPDDDDPHQAPHQARHEDRRRRGGLLWPHRLEHPPAPRRGPAAQRGLQTGRWRRRNGGERPDDPVAPHPRRAATSRQGRRRQLRSSHHHRHPRRFAPASTMGEQVPPATGHLQAHSSPSMSSVNRWLAGRALPMLTNAHPFAVP